MLSLTCACSREAVAPPNVKVCNSLDAENEVTEAELEDSGGRQTIEGRSASLAAGSERAMQIAMSEYSMRLGSLVQRGSVVWEMGSSLVPG